MIDGSQDDTSFRANDHEVAAKVVDGEAILINLSNGLYYSVDKVGGVAWSMIAAGSSITRIAGSVAEHYALPFSQVQADMRELMRELLAEGLIVPTASGEHNVPAPDAANFDPAQPYEAPKLVRYDDMVDMFALDPPLPELAPLDRRGGEAIRGYDDMTG